MDQLPGALLQLIFSKVPGSDCARAACVARLWQQTAHQDALWEFYCLSEFDLTIRQSPFDDRCVSWKATYKTWKVSTLVQRSRRCWATLRGWVQENFQEAAKTLAPGASLQELAEAESNLACRFPPAVRLLYRLCNGQEMYFDPDDESGKTQPSLGLLGGYTFGHHNVNVHLLSLRQVVSMTKRIVPGLRLPWGRRIIIAASSNLNKFFFLDCDDGNVYVGTRNLLYDGEMMVCVPDQTRMLEEEWKDGLLRWLENYAQSLESGIYHVRTAEDGSRSISLYPETEPYCTTAVTRGVQVRCSAAFVPELSRVEELDDSYWFSYSVRMRLLKPTIEPSGALTSCQLFARHWVICAHDTVITEVRGEAVIGLYPLLGLGDDEFVYESCTGLGAKSGSIDGDFTFSAGRLSQPEGERFIVYVARFPLKVPQYII